MPPFSVFLVALKQSFALAEKDLDLGFRFKFSFIAGTFTPALINLGLFATVFFGFFKTGATGLAELNRGNFVAFTLLGALAAVLFMQGSQALHGRFVNEKYWQTIPALLASPLSSWAILIGIGLSDAVRYAVVVVVFLAASYVFLPVSLPTFVASIFLLVLLSMMISGFAMIRGALYLVNENYETIIGYFIIATSYVSCFYYPSSFMPSFLQIFAFINPVFFVVDSLRSLWLGLPFESLYLLIAGAVAVISPIVGTNIFRRVWRNLDITGY